MICDTCNGRGWIPVVGDAKIDHGKVTRLSGMTRKECAVCCGLGSREQPEDRELWVWGTCEIGILIIVLTEGGRVSVRFTKKDIEAMLRALDE